MRKLDWVVSKLAEHRSQLRTNVTLKYYIKRRSICRSITYQSDRYRTRETRVQKHSSSLTRCRTQLTDQSANQHQVTQMSNSAVSLAYKKSADCVSRRQRRAPRQRAAPRRRRRRRKGHLLARRPSNQLPHSITFK